ncbi:MAG: hypothetical protein ACXAC7_06205 [Candidatus Hodarchaeales archaeon]|jgi:hypothetical protein
MTGSLSSSSGAEKTAEKYGYLIIKFSDLGPMPIFQENMESILNGSFDSKGTMLGIYLSLVAGQGSGEGEAGLYGPIPWNETPDHNLLFFAFLAIDPTIQDERAKKSGVMVFIVIFQNRWVEDELTRARFGLEKALSSIFIFKKFEHYPVINEENVVTLLSQAKSIIFRTLNEGDKLLREKAMDLVLASPSLLHLSYYEDEGDRELAFNIIGEDEEIEEEIEQVKTLNMEILFTRFLKKRKFGFIKFPEYKKIAIAVWDSINREEFIEFIDLLSTATPLLESYFGGLY